MARRTHFVRAIALLSSLVLAACENGINNGDVLDDVADLEDLDWLDGGDREDAAEAHVRTGPPGGSYLFSAAYSQDGDVRFH